MARALSRDTRMLILDEPSAVLDQEEVKNLFRVIRDLTAEGVAVVYISHRLEEIREIGDRITVLKDGRTVATGLAVADTPTPELIKLMTGRSIEYVFPPRPEPPRDRGDVVLDVQDLALAGVFSGVEPHRARRRDRRARRPGRRRPLRDRRDRCTAPAGRRPARVTVDGKRMRRGSVGRRSVRAGIGLAPEERKSQGLLLDEAVYRNITVSSMSRFARLGFLNRRRGATQAAELTASLDVRPDGVTRAVRTLSGGNQQKVVLARWLLRDCRVLLLDEPTRGVDVGARSRDLPAGPRRWPTAASPSSSSPARSRRCSVSPTGSSSSARAWSSTRPPPPRSTRPRSSTSSWKERSPHEPGQRPRRAGRARDEREPNAGPRRCCARSVGRNAGLVVALLLIMRRRRRSPRGSSSPASTTR